MDEFEKILNQINIDKLKIFLSSLKESCYESSLLKIAFQNENIIKEDSLSLYQNHFVLFHILYKLQEEYQDKGKYLHIHFMRTFLLDYPDNGKCRFYNEDSSNFCMAPSDNNNYCNFHFNKIGNNKIEIASQKYFYLDKKNFYKLNKETAEAFVNGTWQILSHYDEYKKSFKILNLPESATIDTIKKRFKYLAKKYHPDCAIKNDIISIKHEKFNQINNAYTLLLKMIPFKK